MSGPDHTGLIYGTNTGCIAARDTGGNGPAQCGADEAWAVPHRYRYPKPELVRLYVCDYHGRGRPDAEPLTALDRATIAGRRAKRAAQLSRVTVGRDARKQPNS